MSLAVRTSSCHSFQGISMTSLLLGHFLEPLQALDSFVDILDAVFLGIAVDVFCKIKNPSGFITFCSFAKLCSDVSRLHASAPTIMAWMVDGVMRGGLFRSKKCLQFLDVARFCFLNEIIFKEQANGPLKSGHSLLNLIWMESFVVPAIQ